MTKNKLGIKSAVTAREIEALQALAVNKTVIEVGSLLATRRFKWHGYAQATNKTLSVVDTLAIIT